MDSQLISTAASACGFFKHHPVYGLPLFRWLSPEWSTWSSVLLTVSCCIKSGLATAQRHPREALYPCSSSTLLPAKRTWGCCSGGAWHSSGVCHGLQHMRVLASLIPFFFRKLNTLQLSGRPANLDRADTSVARGLRRRGGVSNHFYSVSPNVCVCVCLALHCVSPGRCGCWMRQLGTCCSSNERVHSTSG